MGCRSQGDRRRHLRRRAGYRVAASCDGPSPVALSGGSHLNLAVVYVEGDVWTFLGGLVVSAESLSMNMLNKISEYICDKIICEKAKFFYVFEG